MAGNAQFAIVATELAESLTVRVADSAARPLSGVPVHFGVTAGGGFVTSTRDTTDTLGYATASWVLGTSVSDSQQVSAGVARTAGDTLRVTFVATAVWAAPADMRKVAGEHQEGLFGHALADSLVVQVVDAYGNPVPGDTVRWSVVFGNGTISPAVVLTDAGGIAAASFIVGDGSTNYALANGTGTTAVFEALGGRILWRHARGAWTWSSPAITPQGFVVFGARDSLLRAVNFDGTRRWTFRVYEGIIDDAPSVGPGGDVYFSAYPGKGVYAIRPDGTLRWRFQAPQFVRGTPAIGADGTIYVLAVGTGLVAIDSVGQQRWLVPFTGVSDDSPAIGPDGTIYVPEAHRGRLHAVASDGSVRWTVSFPGDTVYNDLGTPSVGPDGSVYLLAQDKQLYAIDTSGTVVWSVPLGTGFVAAMAAPAIAPDGTIYVGGFGDGIWAVSAVGAVLWNTSATAPGFVFGTPALATDGTIYFTSTNAQLYALDPSGTLRWQQVLGPSTVGSPVLGADGTIYAIAGTLGLAAVQGTVPLVSGGWPMFMHDPAHTGRRSPP